MREIKFRAWIPRISKMEEVQSIEWHFNEETEKYDLIEVITRSMQIRDEPILEQYTGLHDKNGKEIYEEDIIEYEEDDSDLWGNRRDFKKYREIVKIPQYSFSETLGGPDGEVKKINVEVIGNLHENPELLKSEPTTNI